MIRLLILSSALMLCTATVVGQQKYEPADPIASVAGQPVFLGELHLILYDQLGIRDIKRATTQVQQAAALMLVRRHLAMRVLKQQGGESLDAMIKERTGLFAGELERRGGSMEKHAKRRMSDDRSLRADLAWQIAWNQYLKSRLNENSLKSYFERYKDKYAGRRWDVSQIFLKVDKKDDNALGIAENRMNNILQELQNTSSVQETFAQAAKDNSDAGSSDNGGKLGWVEGSGDLPRQVMTAISKASKGDVVGPITSPLGLHLVLVHDSETKDIEYTDMTDQAQLRRDATDTLFKILLRKQTDTKVVWFISALKPPDNVPLIPED